MTKTTKTLMCCGTTGAMNAAAPPPRLTPARERRLAEATAMVAQMLEQVGAMAAQLRELRVPPPTPAEILAAELTEPGNERVIASVRDDGTIGTVILAPRPYWEKP